MYTITGRWNAFRGDCGRGLTTGGGEVSCRTTSACRRRSRRVYAGDSNRCASLARVVTLDVDAVMTPTPSSWVQGGGLVGGVKNTSSSEMLPTGPMASGHLHSHFHTATRTWLPSERGIAREGGGTKNWRKLGKLGGSVQVKGRSGPLLSPVACVKGECYLVSGER